MAVLSSKEKTQFIEMLQRIPDEKVRYFYLMLGSALVDSQAEKPATAHSNTNVAALADLQARLNR